jgi:glyoxylase-like metal-dependent hydrolase (beta-lactamase superfamily II)
MSQFSIEWKEDEVKEAGPGVWIRVAVDNISWCVLGQTSQGDGAAVIDSLEDPAQADVVRDLIKQTTGKDLKWIVQTHWDTDHIACNPQWKREGAVAVAHQSCLDSAGDWEGRPDFAFDDRATLKGSEETVSMRWAGGTHTPWDTILHFEKARVLHIADLFGWGLFPCQPTPEKIARLREVLDIIDSYDVDVLICGHGPLLQPQHIKRFRSYMEEMLTRVPALLKEGKDADAIAQEIAVPDDMADWWRFAAWKHARNIALIEEFYVS